MGSITATPRGADSPRSRSRAWVTSQDTTAIGSSLDVGESSGSALSKLSGGLTLLSLDSRIARSAADTERLEAQHRSHTAYGFHIEDAEGSRGPAGKPVLAAAPGSVVLLSCGAVPSRPMTS